MTTSEIIGYYSKPPLKFWSNPYKINFNITFVVIAVLALNLVHILTMLDGFVRNPDFPIFAGIPDFSPIFKIHGFSGL